MNNTNKENGLTVSVGVNDNKHNNQEPTPSQVCPYCFNTLQQGGECVACGYHTPGIEVYPVS